MDGAKLGEVLLYCLGLDAGSVTTETLERMSVAEWDRFVSQSLRHGVTALLHDRLRNTATTLPIPSTVVERVRKTSFLTATRNLRLYDKLSEVTSMLQGAAVPTIALKGAHLAGTVYRNIALRPMCDVDLLIHKSDITKVDRLLQERGYTRSEENAKWLEAYRHLGYLSRGGDVSLQFHWVLDNPESHYRIDYDGLFERARFEDIGGVRSLTLAPVDLLLHLCIHGACLHLYQFGLRTLFDVSETIRRYQHDLDWQELEQRGRSWLCARCVYLTLRLAKGLVGARVPGDTLDALAPTAFDPRFAVWAKEEILSGGVFDQGNSTVSPEVARALVRRGIPSKIRYLVRRVWPSKESIERRYGVSMSSKLFCWYYLVNLKELVIGCGSMAAQLLRQRRTVQAAARRTTLQDWLASSDAE